MENVVLCDVCVVMYGVVLVSVDVEIGDDGCVIVGGCVWEMCVGGCGGWLMVGACAAACGLGVAFAMVGLWNGDEMGGCGVIVCEDIDVWCFVVVLMFGLKRGCWGMSSKRGDDDDDASGFGIDGDDDVLLFVVNMGYFVYEEWFKKFMYGKSFGESKCEFAGAAAATSI